MMVTIALFAALWSAGSAAPVVAPFPVDRTSGVTAVALAAAVGDSGIRIVPPSEAAPADSDDVRIPGRHVTLIAPDKLEHASLSFTLGLMIGIATREPAAAFGGSFALGLGKELWDRKRTFFDPRDLMADLVGAAAAAWLTGARSR